MWEMKRLLTVLVAAVMLVFIFYRIIEDDDLLVTFTRPTVLVPAVAIGLWWYRRRRRSQNDIALVERTIRKINADPAVRALVVVERFQRGYAYFEQGKYAAAIADFTSVVESYSADANPAIRELVEFARDVIR